MAPSLGKEIVSARPDMPLSRRVKGIPEALSIYINQLVYDQKRKGEDPTVLSLGEAFFDVPWFGFDKSDIEKGNHYSDSRGIPELRKKLAAFYERTYAAPVDADRELLITAGSKVAIFMAMQAVLDPGDEILIVEPAWLSYQEQARLLGAEPRFIEYSQPLERIDECFTPKAKMLILNNPNNPSGRVYTADELRRAYELCRARGIRILIDEAYSDFLIDGRFQSLASIVPDKDGIIVVNSVSKNMGISGWRVGYLIAERLFVDQVLKINQHLITCASSVLLYYLARHFDEIIAATVPQARLIAEKRRRVEAMLKRLGLQYLPGSATFYFFVSIESFGGSDLEFSLSMLLEDGVSVVPGSAYGESTSRFVRLSIGTEPEEKIERALERLKLRIGAQFDPAALRNRLDAAGIAPFAARQTAR